MSEINENLEKVEVENQETLSYLEDSIKDLKFMIEKCDEDKDLTDRILKLCRCFSDIEKFEDFLIDDFNQTNRVQNNALDKLKELEIKLQEEKRIKELESQLAEAQEKNHSEE